MTTTIVTIFGFIGLASFGYAAAISFLDGEVRAGIVSLLLTVLCPSLFGFVAFVPFPFQ